MSVTFMIIPRNSPSVFSRSAKTPSSADNHFILLFTVTNEAGSLGKAISIIGENGFTIPEEEGKEENPTPSEPRGKKSKKRRWKFDKNLKKHLLF